MGCQQILESTFGFDLDAGVGGTISTIDLKWEYFNSTGKLYFQNNSKFFVIQKPTCDPKINALKSYTLAQLKSFSYSEDKIDASNNSNNKITSGTKIAFQTANGMYGILEIDQYGNNLIVNRISYGLAGEVYSYGCSETIPQSSFWEFATGNLSNTFFSNVYWEFQNATNRYFSPKNGTKLHVIKESITSISEIENNSSKIFPNPAKDVVEISDATPFSKALLFSLDGKLVELEVNENKQLLINKMNPGLYHIKYQKGTDWVTGKMNIQ